MSQLMNRDPFARYEIHREVVRTNLPDKGCSWCGAFRFSRDRLRLSLYRYWIERDAINASFHKAELPGLFCSDRCRRSYHD